MLGIIEVSKKQGAVSPAARAAIPGHKGRLIRLHERLVRWGLDSLTDEEVLELVFRLASPSEPHTRLVKQCIRQFGSLRAIAEASQDELLQHGIAYEAVLLIRLLSDIPARILKQRAANQPVYQSSQAVFDYLCYSMRGLRNEVFKVIHLNGRSQIIDAVDLFNGTVDNIPVIPREILESAIKSRAVAVIYAHNHPSGDPSPSGSDRRLTRDLVFIGSAVQIKVIDHIIVGDNSYFSFADEGLIQKYESSFLMLRMKAGRLDPK